MKESKDRTREFDLAKKPLTRAILNRAPQYVETIDHDYGVTLSAGDSWESLVDTAVVADSLRLLLPALTADQRPGTADGTFPRDRLLAFACAIWFFTTVIPRLEEEGNAMDISRLSDLAGAVLFSPYGEENSAGLIKIGIQYWKELCTHTPTPVVEWHRSFAQMIFIHYEAMINTTIDLGDLDLDSTIGKMVAVFLSMSFSLPEVN